MITNIAGDKLTPTEKAKEIILSVLESAFFIEEFDSTEEMTEAEKEKVKKIIERKYSSIRRKYLR